MNHHALNPNGFQDVASDDGDIRMKPFTWFLIIATIIYIISPIDLDPGVPITDAIISIATILHIYYEEIK